MTWVGRTWRLKSVVTSSTAIEIPASKGANMSLPADGGLIVRDGLNTITGRFTATADALVVGRTISTLAGYGGNDPILSAAIQALGVLTGSTGAPVHGSVSHVAEDTLLVYLEGTTLGFVDAGPALATDPRVLRDNP